MELFSSYGVFITARYHGLFLHWYLVNLPFA